MQDLMTLTAQAFGELEVLLIGLILGVALGRSGYPWLLVCCVIACIALTASRYSVLVELSQEQGLSDPKGVLWRAMIGSWVAIFMISHGIWLTIKICLTLFQLSRMK